MLWYFLSAFHVVPARLASEAILGAAVWETIFAASSPNPASISCTRSRPTSRSPFLTEPLKRWVFVINPLIFSYGLPLLFGLVMGSNVRWRRKLGLLLVGYVVITAVQVWGVVWESLKLLAFNFGEQTLVVVASHGISDTAIALCYQLGTLILPASGPDIRLGAWQPSAGRAIRRLGRDRILTTPANRAGRNP